MIQQKENRHLDPPRYPRLINPLEEEMKTKFEITVKKIVIDLTKQLTATVKRGYLSRVR